MISLSKHIKGAKYVITDCTDTFAANRQYAELLLFQYNMKATVFDYLTDTERQDSYLSGVLDFGIYTFNCQTELDSNVSTLVDSYIDNVGTTRGGKIPNVFSYALGDLKYFDKDVLKSRFLAGRNSFRGNVQVGKFSFRSQSYEDMICRANTFRWNYFTPIIQAPYLDGNQTEGVVALEKQIARVKQNNGWFQNFMHWHWNIDENMELYFSNLASNIDSDCVSATYSEVAEWYWLRNSVLKVTSLSDIKFQITYAKNQPINYDLINIPLYIDVSVIGTSLQGLPIKTTENHNIYKKGTDKYVVEIPLDFSKNNKIIILEEDVSENYVNENLPIVNIDGSNLTSDQPVKTVIFRKTKAQTKNQVITLERQNTLSTIKTLPSLDTVTYDYYICFINEAGISGVLEIN